MGEESRVQ